MAVKKDRLREEYHPVRGQDDSWIVKGSVLRTNLLSALLYAFQLAKKPEEREYLFWEIADVLWNGDPDNHCFAKHRWAAKMIHHACREKYLAVGGAAGAGKSYVFAGWAIVNWLSDPSNVSVLITSTHIKGSQDRIWGSVLKLMKMVPSPPCRIVESLGVLKYFDGISAVTQSGIKIVAADKSQSKDKVGKLIGGHAKKIILIADELGEITENVITAATGNLAANPSFQMIGLSNPASKFDPFGIFATPANGWDSVVVETDYEWRTKLKGYYMRLDSEDSPNFDTDPSEDYDIGFFDYLPTQSKIEDALDSMGATHEEARKSRNFMRFHRAVFFESAEDDTVYSESEIIRARALVRVNLSKPITLAGFDPSFSSGGDKSVLTFVDIGFDDDNQFCICHKEMVYIYEDMTDKATPRNVQIAERVMNECKKRGIKPEQLGVDASGAGGPFCDILQITWEAGFLRVQFGGAASDRPIKNDSKVTARDRYRNRASELFFIGKQFLMGRQIHGLPEVIVKQMTQRLQMEPRKGLHGLVMQVEPKGQFKARTGYSPDETDSFLVAVELARQRYSFLPADPIGERTDRDNTFAHNLSRRNLRAYDPVNLGFTGQLVG